MPLTRYENIAFDWSRVYAVRVTSTDFTQCLVNGISIFADHPCTAVGKLTAELQSVAAERAWNLVVREGNLTVFKTNLPVAIDMSKVCAIAKDGSAKTAKITIDLGKDRCGTLELDSDAAQVILDTLASG